MTRAQSRSGSAFPHYVLDYESRFKEAVIGPLRRQLHGGRDAGALRGMQPVDQVP